MSNQYVNSKKLVFHGHNADHDENHIVSNTNLVIEAKNTKVEGDIEVKYGVKINDSQGIKDINNNNVLTLSANGSEIVMGKPIDFNNVAVSNFSGGGGGSGLPITGDGNIAIGTGNISITNGTITSTAGDIQTGGTADIVSGRNFILDGNTIQKRTDNLGVITLTEYTTFQDCARKSSNNNFSSQQSFADNILMSGTGKTLNNSQGSIVSGTGNIESITCGTVDCDNGGSNSVSAKQYNLRTSSAVINGWSLEQGDENSPAQVVDRVLQIKAGEASGYITITPTDFVGTDPAIILDPNTTANGGKIYAGSYTFGTTADRYSITQDLTGPLNDTLQVSAPTANSKVEFRDNANGVILDVNKTQLNLGNTIPINFGAYSFRPQQFYKDYAGFSFNHAAIGATNLLFTTTDTDWTNRNTGATSQSLDLINNSGAWKITIRQLAGGILNQINGMYVMSDMVLSRPNDNAPNVELAQPTAYSYNAYDGTSPIITMKPGFLVWDIHATFPLTTGNETANIRITMTQMPYF